MKCEYDIKGYKACLSCPFAECVRDDIDEDEFSPQDEAEQKTEPDMFWKEVYGVPKADGTQRKNGIYKGTYYDDRRHQYAREYSRRKRLGLPQPEKKYKVKGREQEYRKEYRANMSEEQKEKYRAWQREYARKKRAAIA